MLQQLPDKENQNSTRLLSKKPRRRRKRKFGGCQKYGRKDFKANNTKLTISMSTWAENFTMASTWQLKHQLAYWKGKAISLEYENQMLHDIIRRSNYNGNNSVDSEIETNVHSEAEPADTLVTEVESFEACPEEVDFEVSEEFIQFLATNAKYKEDARRERELLKAKNEEAELKLEQEELHETSEETKQLLYGSHWQRISALEIAMQSQFISESDKHQPMYWPNIPFNFSGV